MKRMISIRFKLLAAIVLMLLTVSTVLILVSYFTYRNAMNEHYETLGGNIARTALSLLDEEEMKGYAAGVADLGPQSLPEEESAAVMARPGYQAVLETFRRIKESNDVLYLYMIYPEAEGSYFLFDTDQSAEACPYGYFMPYYEGSFDAFVNDFLAGNEVPAIISDEEYGWIITTITPCKTAAGELLGYVCADISMDQVVMDRQLYLRDTLLILAGITVAFAAGSYLLFSVIFVRPVKRLAAAASEFVSSGEGEDGQLSSSISSLSVRSRDELGMLCGALKGMEQNILDYIENLKTVTADRERIGAELDVATHIQKSMLPCIFPAFPDRKEFDIYAAMDPAKEVGGDFYDFFMVDATHLAVVMADVSGKGVPAALFMVIGKTLIKDHTLPGRDLGEVFSEVNRLLCEANSEGLFITAFEGVLDLVTGELRYVNAGHEMPFVSRDGRFEAQKIRPGFVLAGMEGIRYRAGSLTLRPGDKLFQYTDGVTEATDADNKLYGMERLSAALNAHAAESPQRICAAVRADIDAFVREAPQFDDITMLCLEYRQPCEEEVS